MENAKVFFSALRLHSKFPPHKGISMTNKAEAIVSSFYDGIGWKITNGVTEDANRWEDLREVARDYVSKCRLRVLRHIPSYGDYILDMASGPIQYPEYLKFSENFNKRYCVDLSALALLEAQTKMGNHGVFLEGSFLDINLQENLFDCSISLHTIYHFDEDLQEKAVRKSLYLTKAGQPVIIVYSNPFTLASLSVKVIKQFKKFWSGKSPHLVKQYDSELYFYCHSNDWWDRFNDIAIVKIYPWRSFAANFTKLLIPNNWIGKKMFDMIFFLEERFPLIAVKYFQYPMIVLIKRY